MHVPEGHISHLVCRSVDLSIDLSTSGLNDRSVLNLVKYQIKVSDTLREIKNHFFFFLLDFREKWRQVNKSSDFLNSSPVRVLLLV